MDTIKNKILNQFDKFSLNIGGIGGWITNETDDLIFERLAQIDDSHLSMVQFNQLLVLGHEAPMSEGCFKYFWNSISDSHPYLVDKPKDFSDKWLTDPAISSLKHLEWGLNRLFLDSLMFFGNVRTGYRFFRTKTFEELLDFFVSKCYHTDTLISRGSPLELKSIAKDNRYLISEMACKSYDSESHTNIDKLLYDAHDKHHRKNPGQKTTVADLLFGEHSVTDNKSRQKELELSADEILNDQVENLNDLRSKVENIKEKFNTARKAALFNTKNYLSMVNELDVYVATSMRTRKDFRAMADKTDEIFNSQKLKDLNLRYFDPTMSASNSHEDKGLIECLMVKCAKILVYCAGDSESYGKDVEAAMALSLGKPVIFLCDEESRSKFYREIHPLTRLINFKNGVVVGAIITSTIEQTIDLISRIFKNEMQYELTKDSSNRLKIVEALTRSTIRIQSSDRLLTETFWNHYNLDTES